MTHRPPEVAPRIGRMLALAAAVPVLLVATGCGSSGSADASSQLTAGEWVLDHGASSLRGSRANPITIAFEGKGDGTVSGMAPCNSYRGTYRVSGASTIAITGVSASLRACDAATMNAEREYLAVLAKVTTIATADQQRLALTGSGGARLTYSALEVQAALTGTWSVTSISRDDAIRGVSPGLDAAITFDQDGALSTSSACGERAGTWSVDGDALRVSGISDGGGTCAPGSDRARDDDAIARALADAATVAIAPGNLTLLSAEGLILLTATR